MFVAGEHCDHETMQWIKAVFKKPVFDHWWQTETGWPITSTCVGLNDKETLDNVPAGVSGKPVPGYDGKVLEILFD
jgi:propionyl-CoA synthetase